MSTVIECSALTKAYGPTRALDGFDLCVHQGQVHGFLGPNGAGKSTTIRILLGLLRHDGGTVRLLGGDPWADAATLHRRIAYVPGDVDLWPTLTGGEVIDLLSGLRGGIDEGRRQTLVERFELDPTRRCRSYSKGNRQKVALVAALASDAEVVLLDEPTSGLDPLMEHQFAVTCRELADEGRTILLSSHVLSEVEALATHATIIRAGRAVLTGTLDELRGLHATHVEARLATAPDLAGVGGLTGLDTSGDRVRFTVTPDGLGTAMARLAAAGILSLSSTPPSLEELFLEQYRTGPAEVAGTPTGGRR